MSSDEDYYKEDLADLDDLEFDPEEVDESDELLVDFDELAALLESQGRQGRVKPPVDDTYFDDSWPYSDDD